MHPHAELVASMLSEHGAQGKVVELPTSARTAQEAADQLGCDIGAIANSLVFNADGEPLLVLTSGAHRVDTLLVASVVGATKVSRATPEFVKAATGQTIGGVAPIGHPAPIRTLVDVWLARHEVVWAAAGHSHSVFPTTYEELLRITEGTAAEVG